MRRRSSRWSAGFVSASGSSQPSRLPAVDFWWIPPDFSAQLLSFTEPRHEYPFLQRYPVELLSNLGINMHTKESGPGLERVISSIPISAFF